MARLIYSPICSLDGYIEDRDGRFDWGVPDEATHDFITELGRSIGTHLYGRRMYETMAVWETDPSLPDHSPAARAFAEMWRATDKIVFSTTLEQVETRRTHLQRRFDPAAVRELKTAAAADLAIAGPDLAAQAFRAGLVDECHLFVAPIIVGGGKRALPGGVRLDLELLEERRLGGGMAFLRYGCRGG